MDHLQPSQHSGGSPARTRHSSSLLAVLLCAWALGCASPRQSDLERLAPSLDPGVARLLEDGDIDGLRRLASENSAQSLRLAAVAMIEALPVTDDFARVEARLVPSITLLHEVQAREVGSTFHLEAWRRYLQRPVEERRRATDLWQRGRRLGMDGALEPAAKVDSLRSIIQEALPFRDVLNVGDFYSGYVELLPGLGRASELPGDLTHAAEMSLEFGDTTLACQFLGMLGHHFGLQGQESLQTETWDRGLELARRSRSWQEGRLLNYYARLYADRGEEAEYLRTLAAAESVAALRGVMSAEIRFLTDRLGACATLSLWDLVERGLDRGELLLRRGSRQWSKIETLTYRIGLEHIRMRMYEMQGHRHEAVKAARQVLTMLRTNSLPQSIERFAPRPCFVLARFGHHEEARRAIDETIEIARTHPSHLHRGVTHISKADICFLQGDSAGTAASLAEFRAIVPRDQHDRRYWIIHDVLAARLAYRATGPDSAARLVARGLLDLENRRDLVTSSVEVQLRQAPGETFRALLHEMYADRPEVGYALELAWPRLYSGRGRNPEALDPSGVALLAAEGAVPLPAIAPDVVHCVYYWGSEGLVRWVRTGDVIERHLVTSETARLEQRIRKLHARFAAPGSRGPAALNRDTVRELHQLAALLLPPGLLGESDRARLVVTRGGPLAQLPFELLSLESGRHRPLLLKGDIEYAHVVGASTWWPGDASRPGDSSTGDLPLLVVADPAYDDQDRRRISLLAEPLSHSVDEARTAASGTSNAVFLSGRAATRDSILSIWESASRIHVAAHFVQDPVFLYLTYLPTAPSGPGRRYVDLRDIRRADLRRCRLAILSGCRTGARYRNETAELPSLAEGMIAAGAHHVVATHWDVSDDVAARVMHAFHAELEAGSDDPVAALGRVRRALIHEGAPPGVWAPFTIFGSESVTTIPGVGSTISWRAPR